HGVREAYRPGDTISGTLIRTADQPPQRILIRLFWFTSAIAQRQIGLIATKIINNPKPNDSTNFEFQLPEGPWSFSGTITGLDWAIEAIMFPSRFHTRVPFSFGPMGQRTSLYPRDEEVSTDPTTR